MAMRFRFPSLRLLIPALALGMPFAAAAFAQQGGGGWVRPPSRLPSVVHGDPTYNLNTLFAALKLAPDEASAKAIENRIWALWMVSDSETCTLLMARVKVAVAAKNYDLALKLLNAIVEIKPDYVEGWNERATVYYLKDDYARAIGDTAKVLALEPRHFGAWSGLGLMLQELGDDKDALEAFRKALAIDPHLEHVPDVVRELSEKVEGRSI
jgi:tetratricopeptide (TPR) repeat protein